MSGERFRGVVLFYDRDKGYGFLRRPTDGIKFFVGRAEADRVADFSTGDLVEFSLAPDGRTGKLKAVDLRLLAQARDRSAASRVFSAD
jgi:cold shock CspA family protein